MEKDLPAKCDPLPLSALAIGARARVAELRVAPADKPRLMEMGLLAGTMVELIRFAPLGDPVEIKLRGYHLSLRRHEAEQILVNPA
jgi:ferrous iron transport protein A